jgi:hypothetical protein
VLRSSTRWPRPAGQSCCPVGTWVVTLVGGPPGSAMEG